jgi:hypothetical protein
VGSRPSYSSKPCARSPPTRHDALGETVRLLLKIDARTSRNAPRSDHGVEVSQSQLGKHAAHVYTSAADDKHGKELRREAIARRSNNAGWKKARAQP